MQNWVINFVFRYSLFPKINWPILVWQMCLGSNKKNEKGTRLLFLKKVYNFFWKKSSLLSPLPAYGSYKPTFCINTHQAFGLLLPTWEGARSRNLYECFLKCRFVKPYIDKIFLNQPKSHKIPSKFISLPIVIHHLSIT